MGKLEYYIAWSIAMELADHYRISDITHYSTIVMYTMITAGLKTQRPTPALLKQIKSLDFVIDELTNYSLENSKFFEC